MVYVYLQGRKGGVPTSLRTIGGLRVSLRSKGGVPASQGR